MPATDINLEKASVNLKNLTKIFNPNSKENRVMAVNDFNLEVEQGDLTTLLGPSGCGKTTTLRMVAGFEEPTEGKVFVNQENITDVPANKRDSAMVFQNYALFPHMSVGDNILYGLKYKDIDKKTAREKLQKILTLIGMEGYEDRSPGNLSGGQQQRVALARALIMQPKVLLFDEPLSNLDAKLREEMRNEIRQLQQELSITTLYVTHDQDEAMSISDKLVVMNDGEIEQIGPPREIYYNPANEFVADFIGRVNLLPGKVKEKKNKKISFSIMNRKNIEIEKNSEKFNEDDQILTVLRPEAVGFSRPSQSDGKEITGEIVNKIFLGNYVEYYLDLGLEQQVQVDQFNPHSKQSFDIGEKVTLNFSSSDVHFIPAK